MPLKDMVKGLERLMPVGARQFSLMETTGKNDADGNPEVKVTDLSSIQGEQIVPPVPPRRSSDTPVARRAPAWPRTAHTPYPLPGPRIRARTPTCTSTRAPIARDSRRVAPSTPYPARALPAPRRARLSAVPFRRQTRCTRRTRTGTSTRAASTLTTAPREDEAPPAVVWSDSGTFRFSCSGAAGDGPAHWRSRVADSRVDPCCARLLCTTLSRVRM